MKENRRIGAVAQMIASHNTMGYIAERARRGNVQRALEILRKAGAGNPPIEGDELPKSWKARRANGPQRRAATRSK
jgi:hypothetical protein